MAERTHKRARQADPAQPPAHPTINEAIDRIADMSEEAAKMLLLNIVRSNGNACAQFNKSILSAQADTLASKYPGWDGPYGIGEKCRIGNEFYAVLEEFDNTVQMLKTIDQRNVKTVRNMQPILEEFVEKMAKAIGLACSENVFEETDPDENGAYLDVCTEKFVRQSTKRDGLKALYVMAVWMVEAKEDGVAARSWFDYEMFIVCRAMQNIMNTLKPQEKTQLRKEDFVEMLDHLAERVEGGWVSTTRYLPIAYEERGDDCGCLE